MPRKYDKEHPQQEVEAQNIPSWFQNTPQNNHREMRREGSAIYSGESEGDILSFARFATPS